MFHCIHRYIVHFQTRYSQSDNHICNKIIIFTLNIIAYQLTSSNKNSFIKFQISPYYFLQNRRFTYTIRIVNNCEILSYINLDIIKELIRTTSLYSSSSVNTISESPNLHIKFIFHRLRFQG